MSTVLRACGPDFDPDCLCEESDLEPCQLYHRGESRGNGRGPKTLSGLGAVVSQAGFEAFDQELKDAIGFLEEWKGELLRLTNFPGVEQVCIDFGIADRDPVVQSDYFPAPSIRLAGELGLGIEITRYPIAEASGGTAMSDSEILIERLRKSNRRWKITALTACLGLLLATLGVTIVSSQRRMQAEHAMRAAMAAQARAELQQRQLH